MTYRYKTSGTCSRAITVEVEGGVVRKVQFDGGCAGNLAGISKLAEGMPAQTLIEKFRGTPCGYRKTSCPDQLSRALEEALKQGGAA